MPAHTCSHTLAIRGTQLLVLTSPRDGCTRGASLPPAEPPRARPPPHTARAFQTHPGSHPPRPLADTGTGASHHSPSSQPPTWTPPPQSRTHWCACTHELQSHRLSHPRPIKTLLVSHMDTSTHSEQPPFHTDSIAPPETQTPVTLSPYPWLWEIQIHTQNGQSMLGSRAAWCVPQGGLRQEGKGSY